MEPALGRGDIVTGSKARSETYQQGVAATLLVPISGSDATHGREEKNARAPDVHRASLCPGA